MRGWLVGILPPSAAILCCCFFFFLAVLGNGGVSAVRLVYGVGIGAGCRSLEAQAARVIWLGAS